MRKRWAVLLLICLLLPCFTRAENEGFTLDCGIVNAVQWINEQEFITTGHDHAYENYVVTWWKDGQIFRELMFAFGSAQDYLKHLTVLLLPDGSFKAVTPVVTDAQTMETHNYTADWTEQGLANTREVPLSQVVGSCLLGRFDAGKGQFGFRALNADGEEIFRRAFEIDEKYEGTMPCQVWENTFAFQFMSMDDPINDHLLVVVNRDGVLLRKQLGLLASVFGDGNGGWYVYMPQTRKDYDDGLLSHYDAAGQETARKTLRGGETVRRCQAAKYLPDTDTYLLFGAAVANSRKVYDVFTLETDDALNVRSVDVRVLPTEYGDYEPEFSMTPDGVPYVFVTDIAGSFQRPALLLPFASLPGAKDPGITLK